MSKTNHKPFKKFLKRDELIALANESQEIGSESSLDIDDEINSSQKDDVKNGKFWVILIHIQFKQQKWKKIKVLPLIRNKFDVTI